MEYLEVEHFTHYRIVLRKLDKRAPNLRLQLLVLEWVPNGLPGFDQLTFGRLL
jgi:hypothetical protein